MDYLQAILGVLCLTAIKYLDLTDPDTILYVRCAYAAGSLLTLTALAVISAKIQQTNDQQQITIKGAQLNPPAPMAAMLGAPAAPDANQDMTLTHCEYDSIKLRELAKSTLTTMVIIICLHTWKGFMPPLVFQSLLGIAGVMSTELASIHLFGNNPNQKKELKRPWVAKSPFSAIKDLKKEMAQTMAPDTNKAARKNKKNENMMKMKAK